MTLLEITYKLNEQKKILNKLIERTQAINSSLNSEVILKQSKIVDDLLNLYYKYKK